MQKKHKICCHLIVRLSVLYHKSKDEGSDQESIQSNTTPDPGTVWERQHNRHETQITKMVHKICTCCDHI